MTFADRVKGQAEGHISPPNCFGANSPHLRLERLRISKLDQTPGGVNFAAYLEFRMFSTMKTQLTI